VTGILLATGLGSGRIAPIDAGNAIDIGTRIRDGDPTLGWEGDPNLSLCYDHDHGDWVVTHVDLTGRPYIAVTHDRCDVTLILKLIASDNQRTNPWEDVRKAREAAELRLAAELDEQLSDINQKARWAIRRDIGWDTRGQFVGFSGGPHGS